MIYLFLADGFEEIEALATVDFLRRAGLELETVGVTSQAVKGSHNITVMADTFIDDIKPDENLECVILPGGPGTPNLEKSEGVLKFLSYSYKNGKLIAAICAAPSILGHLGYLNGKKAICYNGYENELAGAIIQKSYVCCDGNIITAAGAGVSIDFAAKIVETFCGKEKADLIKDRMKCIR